MCEHVLLYTCISVHLHLTIVLDGCEYCLRHVWTYTVLFESDVRTELSLTFFCVLEPLDKLLHLVEEDTLALCQVRLLVPLQDGVLTHDLRCEGDSHA